MAWQADICGELLTIALTLFICHTNMVWPISTRISATDVTPQAGGATACRVSRTLARALWTATEVEGSETYLQRDVLQDEELPANPNVADVLPCAPWSVTRSHYDTESRHVKLQEPEEISNEVAKLGLRSSAPTRSINGTDSSVSLYSTAKGRSSSHLVSG